MKTLSVKHPLSAARMGASLLVLGLGAFSTSARLVPALGDFSGSSDPDTILAKLPQKLSQTGLYDNVASKTRKVTEGIIPFEVNSPLWTDGSSKERWVTVPVGTKITPTDSTGYTFPDKTILVKNFAIDTVYGDSSSRILVETRFLILHPDSLPKVIGLSYKWRRDQTDADLVDPSMGLDDVHTIKKSGVPVGKQWRYPSRTDCMTCHKGHLALGFVTPQLNRPSKTNAAVNQMTELVTAGILTTNPLTTSSHPNFRWVGLKETNVTPPAGITLLEWKARSYLAANCAHCHGDKTPAEGASHSFDFLSPITTNTAFDTLNPASLGYIGKPTGREMEFPKVVYRGYPESSYVVRRMMARTFGVQMPPLATYQMDTAAVTVMKDWICAMGNRGTACQFPAGQPTDDSYWTTKNFHSFVEAARPQTKQPYFQGQLLFVPGYAGKTVSLHDTRGRSIRLTSMGQGRFLAGATIQPGVYVLKAGRSVSRIQFLP